MRNYYIPFICIVFALSLNTLKAQNQEPKNISGKKTIEVTFQSGIMDCPVYGSAFIEKMTTNFDGNVKSKDEEKHTMIIEIPVESNSGDIETTIQSYLEKEHYPAGHTPNIKVIK